VILVDSSVWIDYFRGTRNRPVQQLLTWLQGGKATVDLGVADLVVFEVMRGFASPKEQKRAHDLLLALDIVEIGGTTTTTTTKRKNKSTTNKSRRK
jgi:predicted nucleic acid-binding protein